jgi:hypothetical protein
MKTLIGIYMIFLTLGHGKISGTIYDENSHTLPGAKVMTICDTTYTDLDGKFTINYEDVIRIQMVSYDDIIILVDSTVTEYKLIYEY